MLFYIWFTYRENLELLKATVYRRLFLKFLKQLPQNYQDAQNNLNDMIINAVNCIKIIEQGPSTMESLELISNASAQFSQEKNTQFIYKLFAGANSYGGALGFSNSRHIPPTENCKSCRRDLNTILMNWKECFV